MNHIIFRSASFKLSSCTILLLRNRTTAGKMMMTSLAATQTETRLHQHHQHQPQHQPYQQLQRMSFSDNITVSQSSQNIVVAAVDVAVFCCCCCCWIPSFSFVCSFLNSSSVARCFALSVSHTTFPPVPFSPPFPDNFCTDSLPPILL